MENSKLRIGLILDDEKISYFNHDLINSSKKSDSYEISTLIIQKKKSKSRNLKKYLSLNFIYRTTISVSFSYLIKFEKYLLFKNDSYKKYFKTYDLNYFNLPFIEVSPIVSKSGFIYQYSEFDLQAIKNLRLDLLIRGGTGILKGAILNICKFGVLSLHHGDNNVNRGGPPGFWEVYHKNPETGFIIQKLSSQLDGGDVYSKGAICTSSSYLINLIRIQIIANIYFDKLLTNIGKNYSLPPSFPKYPYSFILYKVPSFYNQLNYFVKVNFNKIYFILRQFLGYTPVWSVGFKLNSEFSDLEFRKFKIIKNPPNRFLADPFVFSKDGISYCFVEDYDFSIQKAKISLYQLNTGSYSELGTVIDEDFHLSYPFVFSSGQDLYMCPETHSINEIRLYKCVDFPLKWSYHKTLINNISASDTSIFYFNKMWWMLTNVDSGYIGDHSSELHLFYADSFDSDNWISHPLNPIVFSPLFARNGGLFFNNDVIYRVFQRQGFNNYGESMGVSRINHISEFDYKEEVLFNITPNYFSNITGTHTLSFVNNISAVDFVKISKKRG